ncbi:hypothetical protein C7293_19965 [filamentous cyanobacterium CCT1]|nr:hypothetical protein C7293_19965 [filamentous cyanobacterium CCT1]PSN79261.1 hypothetical protein C8B47_12610 [filamentous cyanobacterium CCP4]
MCLIPGGFQGSDTFILRAFIGMNALVVWSRRKVLLPWEEDLADLGQTNAAECWAAAIASLS